MKGRLYGHIIKLKTDKKYVVFYDFSTIMFILVVYDG